MDSDTQTTGKGPVANLAARRAAGQVRSDPVQEKIVLRLQAVHEQLAAMTHAPAKAGLWSRLGLGGHAKPPAGPHGLYIWGPVGRGKSMLMDLFFADAPVAHKRRVHFHEFMRCDVIAEGVVAAAREVNLHVPLVVRLEGTNVELGKKILKESGLKITSAENLADAAEKIVKAVKEAN